MKIEEEKKEQAHCAKSFIIIAIIVLLLSLFTSDSVCSRKGTAWSSLGLGEIQEWCYLNFMHPTIALEWFSELGHHIL